MQKINIFLIKVYGDTKNRTSTDHTRVNRQVVNLYTDSKMVIPLKNLSKKYYSKNTPKNHPKYPSQTAPKTTLQSPSFSSSPLHTPSYQPFPALYLLFHTVLHIPTI